MSEPRTVTITSTVDPLWIDFCTKDTDLFLPSYCGYWLRGVEREEQGWLVWESLEKPAFDKEPNRMKALAAWRKGEALPEHWFRLDLDFALRAWAEGVKWKGVEWFANGDANSYDYAIQQALLGQQRYG